MEETLTAPPALEESLSKRVRRADFNPQKLQQRKLDLTLKTVLDLGHKRCTSSLAFHPYEPLLIAADDRNEISVCNFEEGVK